MSTRIAVFTAGGDAPGLNAVIRAVTRTAILKHGWEVYGIRDGLDGVLLDRPNGVEQLTLERVTDILPYGGTILGTVNKMDPRLYVREGGRVIVQEWAKKRLLEWVEQNSIRGIVAIGGDGTMNISYQLFEAGVPIVGVPKTIDNDLLGTDQTFGFDSAIDVATDALDRLRTTAKSLKRVMILEVMGRNAGWIALHAGIAGGAHVILIPEIPFRLEAVCQALHHRWKRGSQYALVVVAEAAHPVGGEPIYHEIGGTRRLGGVGEWLARRIHAECGYEARALVLGHLQRGGSPSAFDRILATQYGVAAVGCVAEGTFGVIVGLRGDRIQTVPMADVVGRQTLVAPDHPLVKTGRDLGISFGDEPV